VGGVRLDGDAPRQVEPLFYRRRSVPLLEEIVRPVEQAPCVDNQGQGSVPDTLLLIDRTLCDDPRTRVRDIEVVDHPVEVLGDDRPFVGMNQRIRAERPQAGSPEVTQLDDSHADIPC